LESSDHKRAKIDEIRKKISFKPNFMLEPLPIQVSRVVTR
jgi:hypothetical protein